MPAGHDRRRRRGLGQQGIRLKSTCLRSGSRRGKRRRRGGILRVVAASGNQQQDNRRRQAK